MVNMAKKAETTKKKKNDKRKATAAAAATSQTAQQPKKAKNDNKAAMAKGPNSLRNAHNVGMGETVSERKANELWFRKANYGTVLFESYYKNQSPSIIVAPPPPSSELQKLSKNAKKSLKKNRQRQFQSFMDCLAQPLPVAFRIRHTVPQNVKASLRATLKSLGLSPVPYDPTHLIYQTPPSLNKATIRKGGPSYSHPLASFLRTNLTSGHLSRQEIVSMIPVLCLGPSLTSTCLDLCASPGSKTLQLLETSTPSGLIVANDVHPGRVSSLEAAISRALLPSSNLERLIISNHDGSKFPDSPTLGPCYDKVLVDVPCSGDGTIRKDSSILPRWNPNTSNALHSLQCDIGFRGLEVLKVGGVMAYSTCTFNPVEDEAVVAEIVRRAEGRAGEGAVEVEGWENPLPGLVKREGVVDWRVADFVEAGEEEEEEDESKGEEVRIRWHDEGYLKAKEVGMEGAVESLWPREDIKRYNLDRCCRFLPHDNDTGGFFVALLKKHKPFGPRKTQVVAEKKKKKKKNKGGGESEAPELQPLRPIDHKTYSSLCSKHPDLPPASRLYQRGDDRDTIYLVPVQTNEIFVGDNSSGSEEKESPLNILFAGRVFMKKLESGEYELVVKNN
ncbi:hypothetical protein TrVE_jg2022 [Triparma verrucosa]|uniref:SAM-dependent MTase RsmB/NOP-type domain-containing protein n=1 Tax=Triparma verrucosa TaxID=1606542 RepID=A0A9W7F4G0_9STRA|nr:hypothetical protein TrVE_jg2022 [Triparma verrucosa]